MNTSEQPDADLLGLAYPYALDAVTATERHRIEHLRDHTDRVTAAEFDIAVAAVHDTLAVLADADAHAPPIDLEDRLLRALDRSIAATRPPTGPRELILRLRLRSRTAAAAVLLAVGAGLTRHRRPPAGTPRTIVPRALPLRTGGSLDVHHDTTTHRITVTARDIPAAGAGRTYQLWLTTPHGRSRAAALLDTATPQLLGYRTGDILTVTLEPSGGSPRPTSTPLGTLTLD